jgi:uncharacterized protein YkwD
MSNYKYAKYLVPIVLITTISLVTTHSLQSKSAATFSKIEGQSTVGSLPQIPLPETKQAQAQEPDPSPAPPAQASVALASKAPKPIQKKKFAALAKPKTAAAPRASVASTPAQNCAGAFIDEFVCLLNQYRAKQGKGQLSYNSKLASVSLAHSAWMSTSGIFSHEEADGSHLVQRCAKAGIQCRAENLAHNSKSPKNLLDMWIASPGHNANLLGPYASVGLGISGPYITALWN